TRIDDIDQQAIGNTLSEEQVQKIVQATKDLIDNVVNGKHEPYIVRNEKGADVIPVPLGNISEENHSKVGSFMEGLDILFSENLLEQGKSSQSTTANEKIAELEHKLEEQNKAIYLVKERSDSISNVAKALQGIAASGIASIEDPIIMSLLAQHGSRSEERRVGKECSTRWEQELAT